MFYSRSVEGIFFMGIYRKTWPSQRGDPKVRIELPIGADVFSCDLGRATKSNFQITETEKKTA